MPVKYILNPDGTIKNDTKSANNKSKEQLLKYIEGNRGNSFSAGMNRQGILDFGGASVDNKDLLNENITQNRYKTTPGGNLDFNTGDSVAHNTSFAADEDIVTFKNFNSVFEKFTSSESIFVDEFEMLTGYSFSKLGDPEKITTKLGIIIPLITESIIHIAACEVLLGLSELSNSAFGISSSTDAEENFHLNLGEYYTVDTNILQTYIIKTLNYPKSKITHGGGFLERIAAFVVGFNEFINADSAIDWKKIFNNKNHLSNNIEGKMGSLTSSLSIDKVFQSTIYYLAESVVSLSLSSTNRIYMLVRKIQNQDIWNKYKIKARSNSLGEKFISEFEEQLSLMSYYWFKFVIERMHVGYKLIRYFKFNQSVDKGVKRNTVHFLTRVDRSQPVDLNPIMEWKYKDSGKNNSLTTSIRSNPQAFILPENFIKSQILNNEGIYSLGGDKSIMQNFRMTRDKKKMTRLGIETVMDIESTLDASYMPFYFHDLRTNEIISFHAFVSSLSDSFTPLYTPHTGFGRIDDVQHYSKTTRSISVSFTVAATSKEDFDLMWFQINKLVSMCYPQWSEGLRNENIADGKSAFPFTQIPTASPLIRFRLGDLISSNYSEDNINRIHEIENVIDTFDVLSSFEDSKVQESNLKSLKKEITQIENKIQNNNKNIAGINKDIKSIDTKIEFFKGQVDDYSKYELHSIEEMTNVLESREDIAEFNEPLNSRKEQVDTDESLLFPSANHAKIYGDLLKRKEEIHDKQVKAREIEYKLEDDKFNKEEERTDIENQTKTLSETKLLNEVQQAYEKAKESERKLKSVEFNSIPKKFLIPGRYKAYIPGFVGFVPGLDLVGGETQYYHIDNYERIIRTIKTPPSIKDKNIKIVQLVNAKYSDKFVIVDSYSIIEKVEFNMRHELNKPVHKEDIKSAIAISSVNNKGTGKINNPIKAAYNSTLGKGLAGFITSLSFDYNDAIWETAGDSKGPKLLKISMQFNPIHDIPMGLDARGMMRAPAYNIGSVNNALFGKPYKKRK